MNEEKDSSIDEVREQAAENFYKGNLDEAERLFNEALAIEKHDLYSINKLGVIYAHRRDLETAEMYFRKVLEIDARDKNALSNVGNVFLEKGNYEQAIQYYQEAIKADPDYADAYHNMGVAYRKTGNFKKYVESVKEARRITMSPFKKQKRGRFLEMLGLKARDAPNRSKNDRHKDD